MLRSLLAQRIPKASFNMDIRAFQEARNAVMSFISQEAARG